MYKPHICASITLFDTHHYVCTCIYIYIYIYIYINIYILRFTDDIYLLCSSDSELQELTDHLEQSAGSYDYIIKRTILINGDGCGPNITLYEGQFAS